MYELGKGLVTYELIRGVCGSHFMFMAVVNEGHT
jgi:hypothetical protein